MAPKNKIGTTAKGETLTIRLEPKLKWGVELLARKHRRTMSSVLEWAIINAIEGKEGLSLPSTGSNILDLTWDVDEPDRVIKLAKYCPLLLTYEEECIWKIIRDNDYFWSFLVKTKNRDLNNLRFDKVHEQWENLIQIAHGKATKDIIPKPLETDAFD